MKNFMYSFLAIIILSFTSCSSDSDNAENPASVETVKNYSHSKMELDLLDDVNSYRVSIGLNALEIIEHISYKSSEHNQYMIAVQNVNHDGFSARKINLQQVLGAARVGENVAYGYSTSFSTVNAWINSPSHKANLEGDYTHFGVSIKTDSEGKKYYTNMFIKK